MLLLMNIHILCGRYIIDLLPTRENLNGKSIRRRRFQEYFSHNESSADY